MYYICIDLATENYNECFKLSLRVSFSLINKMFNVWEDFGTDCSNIFTASFIKIKKLVSIESAAFYL